MDDTRRQGIGTDSKSGIERVPLPTGRVPVRKDGERTLRKKTSLYLDAELIDEYRERVYIERRHLGELVERALRQYRQDNW